MMAAGAGISRHTLHRLPAGARPAATAAKVEDDERCGTGFLHLLGTARRSLAPRKVPVRFSNATLALNFGFTLSRNIYDQAHILIDMPEQDPLYKKKIDIWQKHQTPKSEHICSSDCTKSSFAIKKVKYFGNKGSGIPQILRAFVRVFYATSIEELEDMAMEAAENDGRLARRPLKHAKREVHAHRMLLSHLYSMIQGHSTAIEQLEIVDDAASKSMHPFRKEMAKDLLAGELQVLRSAHAWVANYCETMNMS